MASWIRVEDDLPEHYKLANMRRILGCQSIVEPLGHVLLLWFYTLTVAWRDGDLQPYGDDTIEHRCHWRGEPGRLMKAFRECGKKLEDGSRGAGFMDGFIVHDWTNKANRLIRDRIMREQQQVERSAPATPEADEICRIWNEIAKPLGLPGCGRPPLVPEGMTPAKFKALLAEAVKLPFLMGGGDSGWRMSLQWLLRPDNIAKVTSGQYTVFTDKPKPDAQSADPDFRKQTRDILARRKASVE